jgi:hypothetical protein
MVLTSEFVTKTNPFTVSNAIPLGADKCSLEITPSVEGFSPKE